MALPFRENHVQSPSGSCLYMGMLEQVFGGWMPFLTPTKITEETLKSGNLFSGSYISTSVPLSFFIGGIWFELLNYKFFSFQSNLCFKKSIYISYYIYIIFLNYHHFAVQKQQEIITRIGENVTFVSNLSTSCQFKIFKGKVLTDEFVVYNSELSLHLTCFHYICF